jgi:hypothetical protein
LFPRQVPASNIAIMAKRTKKSLSKLEIQNKTFLSRNATSSKKNYKMVHFIFFLALFSFFPAAAPSESVLRDLARMFENLLSSSLTKIS